MRRIALALLAILASDIAAAQRIVMYRCTDATGAVTLQNGVPCPKGNQQEKRVVEAPPPPPVDTSPTVIDTIPAAAPPPTTTPLPVLTPAEPAATPDADAPTTPLPERSPPPPLYRCGHQGNDTYFSDSATPAPRCLTLQTLGLDGNPDTGAGQACEMIQDHCEPVAEDKLCEAWQQRLRDAEAAVQTGAPEQAESATVEFERVRVVVDGSVCRR